MTNLVVLLDPMLDQPGNTTLDVVYHLHHNASLRSMNLGYDASMIHG